jgi:parvulin-like peptidyl-prolyl isomerase
MIALALLLAVSGSAAPAAQPLASVDAVQITRADVDERLRARRAVRKPQQASQAVADLVEEALLAAEARRLGIDREPAVADAVDRERRRLAADAFVSRMVPDPTDAQLLELFHLTADTARLVVVKVTTEQEARAALDRVKGGGDLAAEARKGVDAVLAKRGGDTGLVTRAALDATLAAEVFRAQPGALVGPVALQLGWAIARVVERHVADEGAFPARRESIASFAREQRRGHTRSLAIEQLKKKSGVKLDEAFLRTVGQAGPPTEQELDHVVATVNGRPIRYRGIHAALARFAGARGHGAGAARISFASTEVDRLLLEEEALSQGLAEAPSVRAVLPGIERYVLASAAAARIAGKDGADRTVPAVRKRLDELRRAAKVRVDDAAVRALEGSAAR